MAILVTGGSGFIGSHLIRHLLDQTNEDIINVDKLTYAGSGNNLDDLNDQDNYHFYEIDICDGQALEPLFDRYNIRAVMHLAAETHVDRSIDSPAEFLNTNITGTYTLLEVARQHWHKLHDKDKQNFRFHHISTDEVFGDLNAHDPAFNEETSYNPRSPYSASKASSDHLVRAWHHTYGLPVLITNCSNNYGPYQFPEKLIPHMILNALNEKPLPVYGDGKQIRDWLYVEDHAEALIRVLNQGIVGETYCIGGNAEMKNIDVIHLICDIMDELHPKEKGSYRDLIDFVTDRPGHDRRYAINTSKITKELDWKPSHNFTQGIKDTVQWYLNNKEWWQNILNQQYNLSRIGTGKKT